VSPGRAWLLLNIVAVVLLALFFTAVNIFKPYMTPGYVSMPPHPVWLSAGVGFALLGAVMRRIGLQYYASERPRVEQTCIMLLCIGCLCIAFSFGAYYGLMASLGIMPLIIATLFYEAVSRLARRD
jgi:uncharacterized membrane protein YGL010W